MERETCAYKIRKSLNSPFAVSLDIVILIICIRLRYTYTVQEDVNKALMTVLCRFIWNFLKRCLFQALDLQPCSHHGPCSHKRAVLLAWVQLDKLLAKSQSKAINTPRLCSPFICAFLGWRWEIKERRYPPFHGPIETGSDISGNQIRDNKLVASS